MPVSAHVHVHADEENASCCHETEKAVVSQLDPCAADYVPTFREADFGGMLGDVGGSRNNVRLGAPQRECRAPFILTVRHTDERVGVYASEFRHAKRSFVVVCGDGDFEFAVVLSSRACAVGACQFVDGAVRGPATQLEEEAALFAYQQQQLCLKYAQGLSAACLHEANQMHFTSCRFTLNCKTLFVHYTSPHVVRHKAARRAIYNYCLQELRALKPGFCGPKPGFRVWMCQDNSHNDKKGDEATLSPCAPRPSQSQTFTAPSPRKITPFTAPSGHQASLFNSLWNPYCFPFPTLLCQIPLLLPPFIYAPLQGPNLFHS